MEVKTAKTILYIVRSIIIILLLIFVGGLVYKSINKDENIMQQTQEKCTTFIQNNIRFLSPEEAVMGGSRYTTNITYTSGSTTAIVNYEDGHIANTISIECSLEDNEVKIGTITPLSKQ